MQPDTTTITTGIQRQMLERCLLTAITFVTIFGVANLMFGFVMLARAELVMIATLAGLMLWSRFDGPLAALKNLFILHPVILFSLLFFAGGMSGIGFIWSFGIPFIACMVAGTRAGWIWSLLYVAIIGVGNYLFPYFDWLKLLYIGLAYVQFTLLALFTAYSMELIASLQDGLLDDTTKQLKHEKHVLSESRGSHRALLDAIPHAIAVHRDSRWIYCNPVAAHLLAAGAPEDMIGTSIFDYVHADDHEKVRARIRQMSEGGRPAPMTDLRVLRRNGDAFVGKLQSCPVVIDGEQAFLVTVEEASGRKQQDQEHDELKAHLEHTQRLESLGVLAGGIAHDFNNLLAAIMGNAELAGDIVGGESPAGSYIKNIVETCGHAAELCKQMLAYAGKGSYKLEVLDINEMIRSMGRLIRASVGDNIALKIKLDPKLPGVEGDAAQIQQLILNFIVNSADAIGAQPGEIKFSSGIRYMRYDLLGKLYHGTGLPEGEYVVIEVRDNGCGMDQAMQAQIFDPFFTTKETGSGLGLSAVLGIVQGHHGAIQLLSAPGKGTAFRVYLPPANQLVGERMVSTVEVEAWRGAGTVLVVDDDLRVRTVASSLVKNLDFDVLTAEDGREGIEMFREHHNKLVAVLLDMTMPVMGGTGAMVGMREIDRTVPIVLISGYSEIEAGKLISDDRPAAFLQKPFKAKELKSVLYEVMHSA